MKKGESSRCDAIQHVEKRHPSRDREGAKHDYLEKRPLPHGRGSGKRSFHHTDGQTDSVGLEDST